MGISIGVGVVLAAVAGVLIWKQTMRKLAAILALLAGLCLSAWIVRYAGTLTGYSIGGVGIVTALLIILAIIFVHELRGYGSHVWRTPVVGFVLGVLVMTAGGSVGQIGHNAQQATVTGVHNATSSATGG